MPLQNQTYRVIHMPTTRPGQRWRISYCLMEDCQGRRKCRECKNICEAKYRKKHSEMTPEQRMRSNCRAYANTYQRRGKLRPQPCTVCQGKATKFHPDYSRPLFVLWLCRPCRKALGLLNERRHQSVRQFLTGTALNHSTPA